MISNFLNELNKLNIKYDETTLSLLEKYYDYLTCYNEHTNLTAITNKEDVYFKHFLDSINVSNVIDLNSVENIIDIGSGAGFPGIVLKIFYPNIKLTLLDSNNKKTKFLENLVNLLNLKDVIIVNDRAENYMKNHLNEFDLCVSRAVSYIDIILSLSIPFIKLNGKVLLLKGDYIDEQIVLKTFKNELNIKDIKIYNYLINESKRCIYILQKKNLDSKVIKYDSLLKKSAYRKKKLNIK